MLLNMLASFALVRQLLYSRRTVRFLNAVALSQPSETDPWSGRQTRSRAPREAARLLCQLVRVASMRVRSPRGLCAAACGLRERRQQLRFVSLENPLYMNRDLRLRRWARRRVSGRER
jgi:hypothetical protein